MENWKTKFNKRAIPEEIGSESLITAEFAQFFQFVKFIQLFSFQFFSVWSDFRIAKQRHGEWEGTFGLWFHKPSTQFVSGPDCLSMSWRK